MKDRTASAWAFFNGCQDAIKAGNLRPFLNAYTGRECTATIGEEVIKGRIMAFDIHGGNLVADLNNNRFVYPFQITDITL